MDNFTKEESVLCHYKDGKLVAITHFNTGALMFTVTEMDRKTMGEFYGTQNSLSKIAKK